MNIVGTPYTAVHRSSASASSVASGSKPAAGYTIVDPDAMQPRLPIPMPKQWYSGTGMQTRSIDVYPMFRAIAWALFKMLWCVSVAPLGLPVVPLVYWMLMGSSVSSCSSR